MQPLSTKLIAKGAYGCIYHPKLNCDGKSTTNTKYVSKLQENNFTSKNEVHISNIIKTIPNYNTMFAVILRSCKVDYKEIKDTEIVNCPQISNDNVVLMDVEYVNSKDIYTFLEGNTDYFYVIHKIVHSYKHLLNSINYLIDKQVVHFDLKSDNILMEPSIPIIIDFGLSLDVNKLLQATRENLKNYFFTSYPKYYVWSLEVHYICYLLNENDTPAMPDIRRLCNSYVAGNDILNASFSKSFVNRYETECIRSLERYLGKPADIVIKEIIESSYTTWDNYSLSLIMMNLIYLLNFNGFQENRFVVDFTQLLLTNIHPNYEKRLSLKDTKARFSAITHRGDKMIVDSNFGGMIDNILNTKTNFIKALRQNTQHMKRLTANFYKV